MADLLINCAGGASSPYVADTYTVGGGSTGTFTVSNAVDVSGLSNAPAQYVWKSIIYGATLTSTVPVTNGVVYKVRLFIWSGGTGDEARAFNISIDGVSKATAFQPYTYAGGFDKGIILEYTVTASSSSMVVVLTATSGVAVLSGLAFLEPDTTAPTGAITAPSSGATISGTSVAVTGTCSDNVAVVSIQPKIDGTNWGAAITGASLTSFSKTLDSTTLTNGSHTLSFVLSDGTNTTTLTRTVTVENFVALAFATTSPLTPGASVGVPYSKTIQAVGGDGTYEFTLEDDDGLTGASINASTGVLTFTPTGGLAGEHTLQLSVASGTEVAFANFVIVVAQPVSITSPASDFPIAYKDAAYASDAPTAAGGTAPFTWSIPSGALPDGMTINASTGVVSGTASALQTATFVRRVTDANGLYDQQFSSIIAVEPPESSLIAFDEIELNRYYSQGAKGGPTFSTSILGNPYGVQQRNINRYDAVHVFELAFEGEPEDGTFGELLAFFMTRFGSAVGFRFFPYFDNSWKDEQIAVTSKTQNAYPLIRTYESGGRKLLRRIVKPCAPLIVTIDDEPASDFAAYTIDYTTGTIYFNTASTLPDGGILRVTGEYCIPVVFDADSLEVTAVASFMDLQGLRVKEILPAALGINDALGSGGAYQNVYLRFDGETLAFDGDNFIF